jgi:hypothetical protein
MQQISLFSGLSSALNLKAGLGLQIKAPVTASVTLKAQALTQTTTKTDLKSDLLKDIKLGAYQTKSSAWEGEKPYGNKDKGWEKEHKNEKWGDWKEGGAHHGGDTLDLSKLNKFEGQNQWHAREESGYQQNTWHAQAPQPAHQPTWQAHHEANIEFNIELTGQVQHHEHAVHH